MKQHKSRGMALLSLIFSMIIAAILVVIVLKYYQGNKRTGGGQAEVKNPIERTKAVRCLSQRRNIEMALKIYHIETDSYPSSLSEMRGFSEQDTHCSETGALYSYDPVSGKVSCPDHP